MKRRRRERLDQGSSLKKPSLARPPLRGKDAKAISGRIHSRRDLDLGAGALWEWRHGQRPLSPAVSLWCLGIDSDRSGDGGASQNGGGGDGQPGPLRRRKKAKGPAIVDVNNGIVSLVSFSSLPTVEVMALQEAAAAAAQNRPRKLRKPRQTHTLAGFGHGHGPFQWHSSRASNETPPVAERGIG